MADDYFNEVEAYIREAQNADPDVELPWSWWQEQGQKHGMSPNAVYTRAVKSGVYVPPSKRTQSDEREARQAPSVNGDSRPTAPSVPYSNGLPASDEPPSGFKASPEPTQTRVGPWNGSVDSRKKPATASADGGLGEAIHSFAAMVERAATLSQQVENLSRELAEVKEENRHLRKALRQIDDHLEETRRVYRQLTTRTEE